MGEAGRGLSGHVVDIVRVSARFAACHSDAGFGSGAGQVRGKVKIQKLVPEGTSVGLVVRRRGANSDDFEGACPVETKSLLEGFIIGAFAQSLSDCGGCVAYAYPATGHEFGAVEKRIRKCRVASVYASNCESVVFMHELVGALLPFSGEIAIGEMVAVKALVGSVVGAIEDGEGEAQ